MRIWIDWMLVLLLVSVLWGLMAVLAWATYTAVDWVIP
jgi:hypothetical protein